MRAVTVTDFGSPDVLQIATQPDPEPGPGEVVVAVAAADVLWLETMIRSGAAPEGMRPQLPYVPGNGIAGRVVALGAGVDAAWADAEVVAHTGNQGGYADRALVPASGLSSVPAGVSASVAAALLHDGPTALALFDATGVAADDMVLVVGASGGLGVLLVQLGRARARQVVALARGEGKLERVRALGPDATIDAGRPDWVQAARVALGDGGANVVFDNVGGELGEAAFDLVAAGGRLSAHGTPSGRFAHIDPAEAERRGVTVTGIERVQLDVAEMKAYTERALALAAAGQIEPVVGQTFPLEHAADAHAAIEDRSVFGKTLLIT
jgi:NADPH:quinone reductase